MEKQFFATNLQFFASLEDVMAGNADAFGEGDTTKDSFDAVSSKLKDLGYDVLINHREKAEFVPSSRLSEVVAQRETFKQQAEQAIVELNKLKDGQGISSEAQQQIDGLIQQNEKLLETVQELSVQAEIMALASDAINAKDILPFIDMSKVKTDKDGKVTSGAKEEVDRVRTEKPYLFNKTQTDTSKGGYDGSGGAGGKGGEGKIDMNTAIRRAAFGGSRNF
ncbi:MAG: phage scaffolding protein [Firmicutes bacterium]|nr:phage scaffolding protein [Bacillota bacterium]